MKNLLKTKITYSSRVFNNTFTKFKTITLEDFLNSIANEEYADLIDKVRSITDKDERQDFKAAKLPSIRIAGEFTDGAAASLTSLLTNLLIMDIDHIASDVDELNNIKQQIIEEPTTLFCFISPSGDGLKVGIKLKYNQFDEEWKKYKDSIIYYFTNKYNFEDFDDSKIGLNAHCFYSSDPDVFVREDCEVFAIDMPEIEPVEPVVTVPVEPVLPIGNFSKSKQTFFDKTNALIADLGPNSYNNNCNTIGNKIGGAFTSGMLSFEEYTSFRSIVLSRIDGMPEHINTFNNACEHGKLNPKLAKWVEHKPKSKSKKIEVVSETVEKTPEENNNKPIDYSKPVYGETPDERWARERKWRKSKTNFGYMYSNNIIINPLDLRDYLNSLPIVVDNDSEAKKIRAYYHLTKDGIIPFEKTNLKNENIVDVIRELMIEDNIDINIIDKIATQHKTYNVHYYHQKFRCLSYPKKQVNTLNFKNCDFTVKNEKEVIITPADSRFYYPDVFFIDHDFIYKPRKKMGYKQFEMVLKGFCSNEVSKGNWVLNEPKFEYFKHLFGKYLTTNHDVETMADDGSGKMALYIIDDCVGNSKGGSGKSILLKTLSQVINIYGITGKQLDNQFPLDGYNPKYHRAINIQDAEPDVMPIFYNCVGEAKVQQNCKNKTKINLEKDNLFNVVISSNYLPDKFFLEEDDIFDLDNSTNRRTTIMLVSSYWKRRNHNLMDTKFLNWKNDDEKNEFYNDCVFLMQQSIKNKHKKYEDWEYSSMKELKNIIGFNNVDTDVEDFMNSYIYRKAKFVDGVKMPSIWGKSKVDDSRRQCDWRTLHVTFFAEYPNTGVKSSVNLFKEIQKYFKNKDVVCGKTENFKYLYYSKK